MPTDNLTCPAVRIGPGEYARTNITEVGGVFDISVGSDPMDRPLLDVIVANAVNELRDTARRLDDADRREFWARLNRCVDYVNVQEQRRACVRERGVLLT